jgi:pentatricopeptide repeat protein
MIRAYGYVRDLNGVWATWREMQIRQIPITSITLGNMVEALVQNGSPEQGYEMVQKARADAHTRPLVNAVIYGSVLKGFSSQRRFDQIWRLYQEMLASNLQFSLVTYNTLVNACVRCHEMDRIPMILKEMSQQNLKPDTITYSAIIKGYCQEGHINQAFELLDNMNQATTFRPDEFTYNSLIDGCARQSLWDRGLALLEQMQAAGVPPSNFTLSVLVKLASRCKKLNKAFELCEQITQKYNFRLNVHVHNNLLQACLFHSTVHAGLEQLKDMLRDKVRPDARTYKLLLTACLRTGGNIPLALGLLRAAYGLPGLHDSLSDCNAQLLQPAGGLPSELISETFDAMAGKSQMHHRSVIEVFMELRKIPGVKLDSKSTLRLAAQAMSKG